LYIQQGRVADNTKFAQVAAELALAGNTRSKKVKKNNQLVATRTVPASWKAQGKAIGIVPAGPHKQGTVTASLHNSCGLVAAFNKQRAMVLV